MILMSFAMKMDVTAMEATLVIASFRTYIAGFRGGSCTTLLDLPTIFSNTVQQVSGLYVSKHTVDSVVGWAGGSVNTVFRWRARRSSRRWRLVFASDSATRAKSMIVNRNVAFIFILRR